MGEADGGLEVEKRVWEMNSSGQHNGSYMQAGFHPHCIMPYTQAYAGLTKRVG